MAKGESKTVTPEEHEAMRVEARDRKRAAAHRRSAHKDEQVPEEFDWHFSGSFSEQTHAELRAIQARNKHDFVNTFHLQRLMRENRLTLDIDGDEPIIGGAKLLVTRAGFVNMTGEPLPCRVYRVIVDIDEMFSYTFTYCRDKYTGRMVMLIH